MSRTPNGKKVINTHISDFEHNFLMRMARKNSMTITMYLRNLIREDMKKNEDNGKSQNNIIEQYQL